MKVIVYVSNKPEARQHQTKNLCNKLKEQYKEKKLGRSNPIIICPGREPVEGKKYKVNYTNSNDISLDWLLTILGKKSSRNLIVEDCHKLSRETIATLIDFCHKRSLNLHFFGEAYNIRTSAPSDAIVYLGKECEYEVYELEEFQFQINPKKKVRKAGEIPPPSPEIPRSATSYSQ